MVRPERHVQHVRTRLGHNIRKAREARKTGRGDLADAIGVSEKTMAEIENGDHDIPLNTLVRIGRKLRIRLSDLFKEAD